MAIDDNTTYGLTGAQVKDLASRIGGGGGGNEVTFIVTDKSANIDMSYTNAMDALGQIDPMAANTFEQMLNGQFGNGGGYFAFAKSDKSEYLPLGAVSDAIASGKTVRIISDFNNYANSNLDITGMVLASYRYSTSNESITFTFQHTNLMHSAGMVPSQATTYAGSNYYVYSGSIY